MATVRCDGVRMAAGPSGPPGTLENLRSAVRCYVDYLSGGSGDTPLSQVLLKDNMEQAVLEWGIAGCPGDKTEGPPPERAPEQSKGGVAEFLDGLSVCPKANTRPAEHPDRMRHNHPREGCYRLDEVDPRMLPHVDLVDAWHALGGAWLSPAAERVEVTSASFGSADWLCDGWRPTFRGGLCLWEFFYSMVANQMCALPTVHSVRAEDTAKGPFASGPVEGQPQPTGGLVSLTLGDPKSSSTAWKPTTDESGVGMKMQPDTPHLGGPTAHRIGDGFARHICNDANGNPIVQLEPGGPLYCLAFGELAFIKDKGTVVERVEKAPAVDSP